jgi:hypothetical protein
VVGHDVVVLDVPVVLRGKEGLRRRDAFRLLLAGGQVSVGREVTQDQRRRQLDAERVGALVVEGREEDRRAELALVELVGRLLTNVLLYARNISMSCRFILMLGIFFERLFLG